MPNDNIDIEVLALAGITNSELKHVNGSMVGGSGRKTDNIDLRQLAGMDTPKNQQTPNILRGLDFVQPPKSTPLGMFDTEGNPVARPIAPKMPPTQAPKSMEESTLHQLELIDDVSPERKEPVAVVNEPVNIPSQNIIPNINFDFDLFQFSTLKEIIKSLDDTIETTENALLQLKSKKDLILKMIGGNNE